MDSFLLVLVDRWRRNLRLEKTLIPNLEWEITTTKATNRYVPLQAENTCNVTRGYHVQCEQTIFAQPPSIADQKLVETLCAVRAMQRGTAQRLRFLLKIFTLGILGNDADKDGYTPEKLKQAALFGHYKTVIDILDHWSGVTPNDLCEAVSTYSLLRHDTLYWSWHWGRI